MTEKQQQKELSKEKLGKLQYFFWQETNDEETQEWRDDLSKEESALVDSWDDNYVSAVSKLCQDIQRAEGI